MLRHDVERILTQLVDRGIVAASVGPALAGYRRYVAQASAWAVEQQGR